MTLYSVVGGTNDGRKISSIELVIELPKRDHIPTLEEWKAAWIGSKDSTIRKVEVYRLSALGFPEGRIYYYKLESLSDFEAITMVLDTYSGFPGEVKSHSEDEAKVDEPRYRQHIRNIEDAPESVALRVAFEAAIKFANELRNAHYKEEFTRIRDAEKDRRVKQYRIPK